MIIYGALQASGHHALRWSRVLRPLLLVNVTEGRQVASCVDWGRVGVWLVPDWLWCAQLRRAFRSIRNALPQIFYVFLLFIFSLLIFSLMALKLLGKRCESCSLAVSCGCGLWWAELQLKRLGCFWTEA